MNILQRKLKKARARLHSGHPAHIRYNGFHKGMYQGQHILVEGDVLPHCVDKEYVKCKVVVAVTEPWGDNWILVTAPEIVGHGHDGHEECKFIKQKPRPDNFWWVRTEYTKPA